MVCEVMAFGDVVADILLDVPQLPLLPQRHQLVGGMSIEPGGTGNFLIMAARLGLRAAAFDQLGEDVYGRQVQEKMAAEGIDVQGLTLRPGQRTGLAFILIDASGQHVFLGLPGTARLSEVGAPFREKSGQAKILYTNGYAILLASPPELILEAVQIAQDRGMEIHFDPGPLIPEIAPDVMEAVLHSTDVLMLTQEEAVALAGEMPLEALAQHLLARGPRLVAIKRGAEGCLLAEAERVVRVAPFPVLPRDTTGAGDAFDAGVAYGMLRGLPLNLVGQLANAVGAATVTKFGAGTRLPSKAEVQALLQGKSIPIVL